MTNNSEFKYSLPFNDMDDLRITYDKLKAIHQSLFNKMLLTLETKKVPYKVIESTILIDMSLIPEDVNINEIVDFDKTYIHNFYEEVGIVINENIIN